MIVDLVVEGKAYIDGGLVEAAIAIDDGRIVSISNPANAPESEEKRVAGSGSIILPGMVDMHVHLRDLNQAYKEDWYTGTLSALRGGVTLVADMPNNDPYVDSLEDLRLKLEVAEEKALVDFLLYCGLPRDPREVPEIRRIACGFKIYPEDYSRLPSLLESLGGGLLVVHAEDPEILEERRKSVKDPRMADHGILRPGIAETRAVEKILSTARGRGVRLHFTHLSTGGSILRVARSRLEDEGITCDSTLHHALLSSEALERLGGIAKVNPPLRSRSEAAKVFNAVKSVLVDAIASDHAPHALEEKLREGYDEVPPGFPGLEIYLPIILTLILDGRLPLSAIDLYSRSPARILGVRRGAISLGFDGDLAIVELGGEWRINASDLASKAKYTPFEGWAVKARVAGVFIRGVPAYEDGELLVSKGFGRNAREP